MQQEAYTKYHFSNARTQAVAQRLYEGMDIAGEHVGLITYMRTDSTRISPEFYSATRNLHPRTWTGYVGPFATREKDNVKMPQAIARPGRIAR